MLACVCVWSHHTHQTNNLVDGTTRLDRSAQQCYTLYIQTLKHANNATLLEACFQLHSIIYKKKKNKKMSLFLFVGVGVPSGDVIFKDVKQ